MNWQEYTNYFTEILESTEYKEPYNDDFLNYTRLNQSRSNRWLKHGIISDALKNQIAKIQQKQTWILITEPWCGDASHCNPFIFKMSELNDLIELKIQLRDSDSEIDNYLTNGGKSIPILIIRDELGNDLAVWGPRPKACQIVFDELKSREVDFITFKTELQNWYNKDQGHEIQQEFETLLSQI